MKVVKIDSRRDLRKFIDLPYRRYEDNPCWVPPLRLDEKEHFDRRRNPSFDYIDMDLFLAFEGDQVVGRIAAIENHRHEEAFDDGAAFFGFFEAFSQEAASHLVERVESWARERGHTRLLGPVNPSLNDGAGFLIDAFDKPPLILMPYSAPEYPGYFDSMGFRKAKDLLAWTIDLSSPPEGPLVRITQRMRRRGSFTTRPVDMKNFDRELATILEIYSEAWEGNWGFVPPTKKEFAVLAKKLKMIVDPGLILFVEVEGETAAFSVSLPDLNQALAKIRGRLFPFGLIRLLIEKRKINQVRMALLGVRRKYRGKGLFAPLIVESAENARKLGYMTGESSWTLEDNDDISRAVEAAGNRRYKTYRIFEKDL